MAFISIPGHGRVQPRGSVRVSAEWDDYVEAAYLAGNESGIPDAVERDTGRVSLEGGGVATVINGDYNNTVGGVFLPRRLDFKGRRLGVVAGLWLKPNNTVWYNSYPVIWSIRDNSYEWQSLHIGNYPASYTPFCVAYRGNAASLAATTLALPLPTGRGRTVLEGNSFSANVKIFQNGQPTALYRDAYSADIPLNNTIQPVIGNRSTGGRAFTHHVGAIEYMLFLRQNLEQERRESLIDDPYQIFIPDRRRKYSLPSGPIAFAAPENLAGTPTVNSIAWSWSAVDTATGYEIETGPVGGPHVAADVGSSLSYEQTGLSGSVHYEARVRAYR